jgi:peptidoglycan/LPS O-acetylase OafA/YrhL
VFGPLNDNIIEAEHCRDDWWSNILYINNFKQPILNVRVILIINLMVDVDFFCTLQCLGHSWYLANDMQMFIITPIIIFPLWKWPKLGLTFGGILTFSSALIPTIMSYTREWPAVVLPIGE